MIRHVGFPQIRIVYAYLMILAMEAYELATNQAAADHQLALENFYMRMVETG